METARWPLLNNETEMCQQEKAVFKFTEDLVNVNLWHSFQIKLDMKSLLLSLRLCFLKALLCEI